MKMRSERFYSILLVAVTIIWGTSFIATQIALDGAYSPVEILFIRFLLAALFFAVILNKSILCITSKELLGGILCGVILFVSFLLQTFGLALTTPANNAFITATYIAYVPFISWALYRKRPSLHLFFAAFVCFFGVCMLSYNRGQSLNFRSR